MHIDLPAEALAIDKLCAWWSADGNALQCGLTFSFRAGRASFTTYAAAVPAFWACREQADQAFRARPDG
jgi:hypothetical protein